MITRRRLLAVSVALLVLGVEWAHSDSFQFLNGGSVALDVYWQSDTGEGVFMGSVPPGGPKTVGKWTISTFKGHSFWFQEAQRRVADIVTHQGGVWNVVGIRGGTGGDFEVEAVGLKELRELTAGAKLGTFKEKGVRLPKLGLEVPAQVLKDLIAQFKVDDTPPKLLGGGINVCDGAGDMAGHGEEDELVIVSSLKVPLEIQWLHSIDREENGFLEAKTDRSMAVIDSVAASTLDNSCLARLQPRQNHAFVFTTRDPSIRKSDVFRYPGELHLVVVTEGSDAGTLELSSLDEDDIKTFLSSVASQCGEHSEVETAFKTCFLRSAKLPGNGILLPPSVSYRWFIRLWHKLSHWRLCSYQNASIPIERIDVSLFDRTLKADVLRKEPLVLAVYNFSTPDECNDIQRLVGRNEDLGRAFTSGGTRSKGRRTNSRNLYVKWDAITDSFTKVANRFYEVARMMTGYELYPAGQEPVNWLYYKPGFEYLPHCDGACGSPSVPYGNRVMTSLLYCTVADEGGHTVFPPDGLKFTPSPGSYLLFSYNPDPTALTKHSACPVLKGIKTTATQWYREGVSDDVNWEAVNKGAQPSRREL